jgi:hypothetical protein
MKCLSPSILKLMNVYQLIESSVAFNYTLSRGQDVKWHQNLSFVYVAAHQNSIIKQVEDRLLALGLRDMNFISKTFEYLMNHNNVIRIKQLFVLNFNVILIFLTTHYDRI